MLGKLKLFSVLQVLIYWCVGSEGFIFLGERDLLGGERETCWGRERLVRERLR